MEFVERSYWENQVSKFKYEIAADGDLVRQLISRWLTRVDNKTALEIGCVPGRYLGYLGTLGYKLYGIDVLSDSLQSMKEWLVISGFRMGEISCMELESMPTNNKFDLVCSFGLLEHFEDYRSILKKHMDLVATNGLVIITTPNFRGWGQNLLHQWLDKENLLRHNVLSMQPAQWADWMEHSNFEILYQGYFGYFSFWVEESDKRNWLKKMIVMCLIKTLPITSRLLPKNTKSLSPFCGVVARKK